MAQLLLLPGRMTPVASSIAPDRDVEGRVIAQKYRLESKIGEGGMGAVWRAFHLQLEVPVAIKLLRPGLNSPDLGERLRTEARAVAKLVHPSIVRVFDIGEAESGEPFIVMELLEGESLGDILERGPLSAVNALQLLLPIGEALSVAHAHGVVHRDLKPDNIFIANAGSTLQPKLLDFGIAKVRRSFVGGAQMTQTGMLMGSPDYMSPEQACGRSDIDQRSDVWAFCVVLYEAISGRAPFEGDSCPAILRSVITDTPLPLELFTDVDPQLSGLIQSGLAKDRDARPTSMFDLGRQLALWLTEHGASEDATGSSLDSKWLGRSIDSTCLSTTPGPCAPEADHEEATLVSVVHPSPRASSAPISGPPSRHRGRWVASAVVVCGALAAAFVGWVSMHQLKTMSRSAGDAPQTAGWQPSSALAAAAPARREAVTVDALALEPAVPPPVTRPIAKPAVPAKTRSPSPMLPTSSKSTLTGAIPSALPQALPARENHSDLLNPY